MKKKFFKFDPKKLKQLKISKFSRLFLSVIGSFLMKKLVRRRKSQKLSEKKLFAFLNFFKPTKIFRFCFKFQFFFVVLIKFFTCAEKNNKREHTKHPLGAHVTLYPHCSLNLVKIERHITIQDVIVAGHGLNCNNGNEILSREPTCALCGKQ